MLKVGDKVIYEGKKSLYFDVGKCYTVTKIKNTSIYLVDDTKEEHEWEYKDFFIPLEVCIERDSKRERILLVKK